MFKQIYFKNLPCTVVKNDSIRLVHTGDAGASASIKHASTNYTVSQGVGATFLYRGGRVEIRYFGTFVGSGCVLQKTNGGICSVYICNTSNPARRTYIDGDLQPAPPTYLEELAKLDQNSKAQYIPNIL